MLAVEVPGQIQGHPKCRGQSAAQGRLDRFVQRDRSPQHSLPPRPGRIHLLQDRREVRGQHRLGPGGVAGVTVAVVLEHRPQQALHAFLAKVQG